VHNPSAEESQRLRAATVASMLAASAATTYYVVVLVDSPFISVFAAQQTFTQNGCNLVI
jgi:hypothetical protein